VARALAADPPLVLMDEPFGALDPIARRALQREFMQWKARLGKAVLLVTHDVREAFRLADRVAVKEEGRILQIASPSELRARPVSGFVRDFLTDVEEGD
ncbi:MAG: ABC transporter ATP-binding protein, partial [Thermoanaerobaculia bacterium]|nr:ABC transporter ATP-binding protein [Thermoanaerobaculia bacterium]